MKSKLNLKKLAMIRSGPILKANELISDFLPTSRDWDIEHYAIFNAKQNALKCISEILNCITDEFEIEYWNKVKQEVENYERV